ncbi:Uncharacterised protein [Mycobacteroides abscessus subsp. abscessus]|nr:Uncharacterised protein [Mycobacteroides abscessus subsp. abscessus]SIA90290.1 Uncharacterised protein [Mycobacteroides abscessus subsp. abscessus]
MAYWKAASGWPCPRRWRCLRCGTFCRPWWPSRWHRGAFGERQRLSVEAAEPRRLHGRRIAFCHHGAEPLGSAADDDVDIAVRGLADDRAFDLLFLAVDGDLGAAVGRYRAGAVAHGGALGLGLVLIARTADQTCGDNRRAANGDHKPTLHSVLLICDGVEPNRTKYGAVTGRGPQNAGIPTYPDLTGRYPPTAESPRPSSRSSAR